VRSVILRRCRLSVVLEGESMRKGHYCPDWDYMWIGDSDPEIECCTCEHKGEREIDEEDQVRT